MAGLNKPTMNMDPSYVKYQNLYVNKYKHFRWTPRTAWLTIAYVVLVPSAVGYLFYQTDGKYYFRGKRRGDIASEF